MLVGHFAAAFAAKRIEPRISLGTLGLAAMLADVLWTLFMLAGIEHASIRPGVRGAANYFVMADVPFSHSLLMAGVWAALFGAAFYAWRRNSRGAWILFAAVLSHWILDVVSHRPDMTIAPGRPWRLGLGLWGSVLATLAVEGGAWLASIILYMRATRPTGYAGSVGFWIGAALLTFIWYDNVAHLPHSAKPDPIGAFIVFSLFVGWTFWMNRARWTT